MHSADNYIPAERFAYSLEQFRLMDAELSLLEAIARNIPPASDVPISPSIRFRRNVWGRGEFYNGVNSQPLAYDDLTSKIPIEQVLTAMEGHITRLTPQKNSRQHQDNI